MVERDSDPVTREQEAELVARAGREPAAFGRLYEMHVRKIYNYIYYRTGNHYDAEDLTAQVFFRALEHIDRYQERGAPFSAWLYRIAHNVVANWHRSRNRSEIVSLEEVAGMLAHGDDPHRVVEHSESQELLLQIIRGVPSERQQLLILKFVARYSNQQIGQIMGRSEGAIKSLYHRTLLSLRKELSSRSEAEND